MCCTLVLDQTLCGSRVFEIHIGISDDVEFLNAGKPQVEIHTQRMLEWVETVEGAMQVMGMLKTWHDG